MALYKKEKVNSVLFFQAYYPISAFGARIINVKTFLFIGGSGFYWSYLEYDSMIGKIFAYANLPLEKFCHKLIHVLITLSKKMVKMIGLEPYENKTRFALPRLDKGFFNEFKLIKKYETRQNIIGFVGLICKRKGV